MTRWIIDRRHDALWLLGGVLVSYAFLIAHVGLGIAVVPLWWLWIVLLDGPHVFATLSRTYLDREERRARRRLLAGSLAWFALAPATFLASMATDSMLPFAAFMAFANVWAYYHVVRQHYGFLVLYQKRNQDDAPLDRRIDSVVLYAGLIAPFASFALTHPDARRMLGLPAALTWERGVSVACYAVLAAVVVLLIARQVGRARSGLPLDRPKLWFFAAVLPLSAILFSPWIVARADFGIFPVVVTAFHNIQYHAIVWFYHRNRYRAVAPAAARDRYGIAVWVGSRFVIYAVCGVVFTLAYRAVGCAFGAYGACERFAVATPIVGTLTRADLAYGVLLGFALHHYYLDQKIWRVSRDANLKRDLRLPGAAATP